MHRTQILHIPSLRLDRANHRQPRQRRPLKRHRPPMIRKIPQHHEPDLILTNLQILRNVKRVIVPITNRTPPRRPNSHASAIDVELVPRVDREAEQRTRWRGRQGNDACERDQAPGGVVRGRVDPIGRPDPAGAEVIDGLGESYLSDCGLGVWAGRVSVWADLLLLGCDGLHGWSSWRLDAAKARKFQCARCPRARVLVRDGCDD
jgi:hypothetical protein